MKCSLLSFGNYIHACMQCDNVVDLYIFCMQGDESFKCEKCGEKTQATKRLRLYRLPKVLLLHIKRFKYSGSSREKLTNNVTFPIKVQRLLLKPTVLPLKDIVLISNCPYSQGPWQAECSD